jgi:hypothetical protein
MFMAACVSAKRAARSAVGSGVIEPSVSCATFPADFAQASACFAAKSLVFRLAGSSPVAFDP